jgi:hypothetical protein
MYSNAKLSFIANNGRINQDMMVEIDGRVDKFALSKENKFEKCKF